MKNFIIATILVLLAETANATSEHTLPLGDVIIENIKIEGRIQTWTLQKVCIDGQVYLLVPGLAGPNGISPSFKDGVPEQCQRNNIRK